MQTGVGSIRLRILLWCAVLAAVVCLAVLVTKELRTSRLQARYLTSFAQKLTFRMGPGPSPAIRFPDPGGPYDKRLGYAFLPTLIENLKQRGYSIQAQARVSPEFIWATDWGVFPIYPQKIQTGLKILDEAGEIVFCGRYPEQILPSFESIPELIVKTLLFIENRELLDPRYPKRNPAVEWDRLFKSALEAASQVVEKKDQRITGGSTLATQMEKFLHSPEGRTSSVRDKARQMISASLRSYLQGTETVGTRRQLILDYINSVPLAAIPGYGEVNGLGDGLWAWYGQELDTVRTLLDLDGNDPERGTLEARALAYKQVLSLFLAHRRPSDYLLENPDVLKQLTGTYLQLLHQAGVVSSELTEAAVDQPLLLRRSVPKKPNGPFSKRKAAHVIRSRLSSLLDLDRLYDLDRLDLTVKSTLDSATQEEITQALHQFRDPSKAEEAGLFGFRLLERSDFDAVVYSFTLYERGPNANLLRVQTDNLDQPFDINQGVKLELGSSAKLRTLVNYLEIVAALHEEFAALPREELLAVKAPPADHLTRWAIEHLSSARDKSLPVMLEAAMERRYSASPSAAFFTGGGQHTFANFNEEDNQKVPSVREAFRDSINLAFIRLMRDIVRYYMYRVPGSTALVLRDSADPLHQTYLARFADQEGRVFMKRFYNKYRNKSPDQVLEVLLQGIQPSPRRLATIFRSVDPEAGPDDLESFLRAHLPNSTLSKADTKEIYDQYSPTRWTLADRGYLAHLHPLELWTLEYLGKHPQASLEEIIGASTDVRQEVYKWLFHTRHKSAQRSRIRMIVEIEAFQEIHRSWKRLGYPFGSLVPSYATAIGSSADRPAALAELVGIILNGGIRYPLVRIEELHFAEGTPYETIMRRQENAGERVLPPEVASVVRDALLNVVEQGTAQRLSRSTFVRADGTRIPVGGKTGTGDNRYDIYGPGTVLLESRVINRTATFAFFIGDRFFGTITAYVPQPQASRYTFTSSLPVQILKVLAPKLMPLIERAEALDRPPQDPSPQTASPSNPFSSSPAPASS